MSDEATDTEHDVRAIDEDRQPKFGEPFLTLPVDDFHAINAATIHHAPTTNADLMRLIQLRPSWETLAPGSTTPHLLRRILSDDTAIAVLTDTVAELREQLAAAEADREATQTARNAGFGNAKAGQDVRIPSRAELETEAAHDKASSSFWTDLNQHLEDPEFRKGYIETSLQIQAYDEAANADGSFRGTLRDQLVTAGTAAADQWLTKRANRRMNDVNRRRLAGHVVNVMWDEIVEAAVGIAEYIGDERLARAEQLVVDLETSERRLRQDAEQARLDAIGWRYQAARHKLVAASLLVTFTEDAEDAEDAEDDYPAKRSRPVPVVDLERWRNVVHPTRPADTEFADPTARHPENATPAPVQPTAPAAGPNNTNHRGET